MSEEKTRLCKSSVRYACKTAEWIFRGWKHVQGENVLALNYIQVSLCCSVEVISLR